jgi:glycosyltransferase involved in cell wall biosynthesis
LRVALLGCVGVSLTQFRGRLIDAMVARGHEVIGCAADHDPRVVAELGARGARFRQVPLDRTGLNPLRDLGSVLGLRRIFDELRPDMLLAYTMKPMVYGALAARLARVGRIFTMVEGMGYAFADGSEGRRRFLRAVQQPLYRLAFSLSNATFVLNPDDRDLLRRRRLAPRRHELVLLNGIGIDLAHFAYAPPPVERPSFLLVGRLIKDKGVVAYADAARRVKAEFPKARFALLGSFDSSPGALAPDQVEAWQREGIIDYLGTVHDVRPVIADADVFVLPSTYREGVPRSTLEAMAMGRPIITTDAPGCRETVRHGENGYLVAKHDVEGLAVAMRRFAAAPELALPMGLASRRLVEARFDDREVNDTILETMRL